MSEVSAVRPHLERRFDLHRVVFWHDPEGQYASDLDSLDLLGVTTIRVVNDEYAVKNRLLHDHPEDKFLVYRSGAVPAGIGNWLFDLELAYGVFTADRSSLVSQDLGLTAEGIDEVVQDHEKFFNAGQRVQSLKVLLTPDDDAARLRAKMSAVVLKQKEHSLLEITRTLLSESAKGQRAKYDALADYGLDDFYWRGVASIYGYDAEATDRVNRDAIALMHSLREGWPDLVNVVISGVIGPRGDGYVAGERPQIGEAADYHRAQIESFAGAHADVIEAITMTTAQEAAGIVRGANAAGVPVGIMFTVEVDGTLPDGSTLGEAITLIDEVGDAAYFGVNCAHPIHLARGLTGEDWAGRIVELRPNASTKSHEELDAMTELDAGDINLLVSRLDTLRARLPGLSVVGGCCGTDARHVAGLWGLSR